MRSARARVALAVMTATLLSFHPARARADGDARPPLRFPALEVLRLDVGVRTVSVQDIGFSGGGQSPGGGQVTVSTTGRALGLSRLTLASVDVRPELMVGRHIAFGAMLGFAGASADTSRTTVGQQYLIGPTFIAVRGGATMDLVWISGHIDIRTSLGAGVQTFMLPMHAFVPTPCGRTRCVPNITGTAPFVEPRVALGLRFGPVSFGGYVAADVLPSLDVSAGLTVACSDGSFARGGGFEPPAEPPSETESEVRSPAVVDLHADGTISPATDPNDSW